MTAKLAGLSLLAASLAAMPAAAAVEFETLYIELAIPFENEANIDPGVLGCELGEAFSLELEARARDKGFTLARSADALTDEDDFVAIMITDVVNEGGRLRFRAPDKGTSAFAELYIDGQSIAWTSIDSEDVTAGRFRPSCGVLKVTVENLAGTIADWLAGLRT